MDIDSRGTQITKLAHRLGDAMDIFGTIIPFFGRPNNYSEMLTKLAGFSWECVLCISLMRRHEIFDSYLSSIENEFITKDSIPENLQFLSPLTLAISLAVAILFHFTQIHNQIQRLFCIRKRFDTKYILIPLANGVSIKLSNSKIESFHNQRRAVMQNIFYRYASSTKSDSLVDSHNIIHSLWRWTIYWALEEGALVFLTFSFISFLMGFESLYIGFFFTSIIFVIIMICMKPALVNGARAQLEQILDDKTAKARVRAEISAL